MTVIDLFRDSPAVYLGVVGMIGLLVGSFLNVVIHRLPIMMDREWEAGLRELEAEKAGAVSGALASAGGPGAEPTLADARGAADEPEPFNLAVPRSRCPSCGTAISAWRNVPIVSWLLLRGRCAHCHAPISVRYPLVEAATMLLSLAVAWRFGPTPEAALGLVVTWFLVAMSMIDVDRQLLPDSLTLPLMWIGLLASLLPVFAEVRDAVVGAALGYLILWSIYWLFRMVTGKEGMGYGDFKLLAALGALLGWQVLPMVILLSSLVGAVVGIGIILATRRSKEIPIPFGPYLAAAGWIAMLWGDALNGWYGALLV